MEVENMTVTSGLLNSLLEAIAQVIECKTGNKEAAAIVRSFKLQA